MSTTRGRGANGPDRAKPERPAWPLLILRSPRGQGGPKELAGRALEGTWRSHQVPLTACGKIRGRCRPWRAGCAPTALRSSSTPPGGHSRTSWRSVRGGSGGWVPHPAANGQRYRPLETPSPKAFAFAVEAREELSILRQMNEQPSRCPPQNDLGSHARGRETGQRFCTPSSDEADCENSG